MKLWIAYILGSFVIALLSWRMRRQVRDRILIVLVIGVLIGYYFLKQI